MLITSTDRILLRHFHVADVEAMVTVFEDEEVIQSVGAEYRPRWVAQWVQGRLEEYYQKWGFGLWAVALRSADSSTAGYTNVVGFCGLNLLEDAAAVDIAYRIAPAWRRRGLATEAAAAVRDYAFDTLGLARLIAVIKRTNVGGIRVAEKIGMTAELETEYCGHDVTIYALQRPQSENACDWKTIRWLTRSSFCESNFDHRKAAPAAANCLPRSPLRAGL